jgi:Transposase
MQVVHPICCGIDVHQAQLTACLRRVDVDGQVTQEVREFATTYDALLTLSTWLTEEQCPIAALESTGVYWRPVYHVLVGTVEVLVGHAQEMRRRPGHKTDKADARWIAELLAHDLDAVQMNVNEDNPGEVTTGTRIQLKFFNADCSFLQDAVVRLTKADAQYFALHDPTDANGQFGGLAQIAPEGVILPDGGLDGSPLSQLIDGPGLRGRRCLASILLINGNDNSPIRIDSIPCLRLVQHRRRHRRGLG